MLGGFAVEWIHDEHDQFSDVLQHRVRVQNYARADGDGRGVCAGDGGVGRDFSGDTGGAVACGYGFAGIIEFSRFYNSKNKEKDLHKAHGVYRGHGDVCLRYNPRHE